MTDERKSSVPDKIVGFFLGFNLAALVVILICAVSAALLGIVLATSHVDLGDQGAGWLSAGLMFVVGLGAERLGFKPRVLFMPFWFVGLVVIVVQSFNCWGWWGVIPAVAALLGVFGFYGMKAEKQEWQAAPESLEELKVALLSDDPEQAWTQLESAFFFPEVYDLKPSMAQHDLQVMALLRQHLEDYLNDRARQSIGRLKDALTRFLAGEIEEVKPDFFKDVKLVIDSRGKP